MNIVGIVRAASLEEMDAVQYYRNFLPLRFVDDLENATARCVGTDLASTLPDSAYEEFDVILLARMVAPNYGELIDMAHDQGSFVVFDSDDDLTEEYRLVSGRGAEFKEMLAAVDLVTVSTPELAELFARYTARAPEVLPNHIDTDWFTQVAATADRMLPGVTIGFSGSPTHWGDWYIPSAPFSDVARRYSWKVTPLIHGDPPSYMRYIPSAVRIERCSYMAYPAAIAQFDVVLCAVDPHDPFNRGKSGVKPLEAMAGGAVAMCSAGVPAYERLAEAGAPIVMVEHSADAWHNAMVDILDDDDRRTSLQREGVEWVRDNRDIRGGAHLWLDAYRSLHRDANS